VAVKDVDSVGVEAASSVGAGSRRPGKRRRGHGWHSCGLDEDFCTMVGHAGGGDRDFFLASRWTDNSGSIHIDGRHRFQTTKKHIIPYAVYDELVVVHYGDVNDHQPSPDDSAMRVVTPL
jgi:hypothetical protein